MGSRRACKRPLAEFLDEKVYRFRVLLPNGGTICMTLHHPGEEMSVNEFVRTIRAEVEKTSETKLRGKGKISWGNDIYLEDMHENRYTKRICFELFTPNQCHNLRLLDGTGQSADTFENMWDLTPDTDILAELPQEYTFVTALADLIDNSLQAVWLNGPRERRFVCVTINESKIIIFDSGPGMDGKDENSIVKWGKMGSSNHRVSRNCAIGGRPPYLMPFFGMFGYGGAIASMHLGRSAVVTSKTKASKKVYTLHLERETLLRKSGSAGIWRADGGIRDPLEEEMEISPHGSFTKVEICQPKVRSLELFKLQCMLKDIYFPYIQCDEGVSAKTTMPIEFQVNDVNLAEVDGGEAAITNLHSCNGSEFVLQVSFSICQDKNSIQSPGFRSSHKAHARLRCVYFPIIEGKENLNRILERLDAEGCGAKETFENFCRVSIRRLGRLLPDARWAVISVYKSQYPHYQDTHLLSRNRPSRLQHLPFMEPKLRKGDKAHLLRRCSWRVKCFVDTDAGFSPTRSKTDLAHHDAFTTSLKNLGNKTSEKQSDVVVSIYKDGKSLSILQLEKEYQDWIIQMHEGYDEEVDCGEDEAVLVIRPCNKKRLGITSDVVRVHQIVKRNGFVWRHGQRIKFRKGSVSGAKNNLYMTLEYILLEGFQGDMGGEARIICRPLACSDDNGCSLVVKNGNATLDIHDSLSYPISVIDSGKCLVIDDAIWNDQIEKRKQKTPSMIDILGTEFCRQLGIEGEIPVIAPVSAGYVPPDELVVVIRPASYNASNSCKMLDQRCIITNIYEMTMNVKWIPEGQDIHGGEVIHSDSVIPSSCKGFQGLYIFPLGCKYPKIFHNAGLYVFCFTVICKDSVCISSEVRLTVKPAITVGKWSFLCYKGVPIHEKSLLSFRIGEPISQLSVACYDSYSNRTSFSKIPEVVLQITAINHVIARVSGMTLNLSSDKMSLEIKDVLIKTGKLDMIRPCFEASLEVCSRDMSFSAEVLCRVLPGTLHSIKMQRSQILEHTLVPDNVIQDLQLEMLDFYGNHIEQDVEVRLDLNGLSFQDHVGSTHKVNEQGYVYLSGLLKVTASYGASVHFSVYLGDKMIFMKEFQIAKRVLRVISGVPRHCITGSTLENIVFEIVDSKGIVDKAIDGGFHTLSIKSDLSGMYDAIQYSIHNGKCIVPVLPLPREEGTFQFLAYHTHHPQICTSVEVNVTRNPKPELVDVMTPAVNHFHEILDDSALILYDSSQYNSSQMDLLDYINEDALKLEEEIAEVAALVRDHEKNLKMLEDERAVITQKISDMQASVEPQTSDQIASLINSKEQIMKHIIEVKDDTAAAVVCHLSKAIKDRESTGRLVQDVLSLVSLLGTVRNGDLSRMLSGYLGEIYMLAIVCKSYEAACSLEIYGEDDKINHSRGLYNHASLMGMVIKRNFCVICLEDLRPYMGKIGVDPQRKLDLPDPLMATGQIATGFLGYAVNMIDIDIHHLHTRTRAGFGLRETLFYCLFGELQVYQTRRHMQSAKPYIRHGAISLDGGVMKQNGVIILGEWEPDIKFPLVIPDGRLLQSEDIIRALRMIEKKKGKMIAVNERISEETAAHSKALVKFKKRSDRLRKFWLERRPLNLFGFGQSQEYVDPSLPESA